MLHIGRVAFSTEDITLETVGERILESIQLFCTKNKIKSKHIRAIIFSQTRDITTWNPAQQLRASSDEFSHIALFCTLEPEYSEGRLNKGIRLMIFFNKFSLFRYWPKSVYIYGAEYLRKDITN